MRLRLDLSLLVLTFSRLHLTAAGIALLCLMLALPSSGSAAPTTLARPTAQTSTPSSPPKASVKTSPPTSAKTPEAPETSSPKTPPPAGDSPTTPADTHAGTPPATLPASEPRTEIQHQQPPGNSESSGLAPTTPPPASSSASVASHAAALSGPHLLPPAGGLALAPYLQSLPDPKGTLTITDVAAAKTPGNGNAEKSLEFQPYAAHRIGDKQTGGMWLRFTLGPTRPLIRGDAAQDTGADAPAEDYALLDLGDQTPGEPQVWVRPGGKGTPKEVKAGEAGLYPLTSLTGGGEVYLRLNGQPGLWFAPSLRTLADALHAPERRIHPLTLAALAVLLMLCVVRSVTERGDGRIWAAIFAGAALLHAFWGVPATSRGAVLPVDMPGILGAGVALMLLPHVGRNIMRTRDVSPATDVLLLILALPGAAAALLPLLPGQAWTARLLSLWPLGAALPLLPALYLLIRGAAGSGLFFLACLGMTSGSLVALWGTGDSLLAPLWGQGPLLGVTFATLLLAAAPRSAYGETDAFIREESTPGPTRAFPGSEVSASGFNLTLPAQASPPAGNALTSTLKLEEALRAPLDALLREACALDQTLGGETENLSLGVSLSGKTAFGGSGPKNPGKLQLSERDTRQARRHADNLVAASRELATLVTDIPRTAMRATRPPMARRIFELRRLVEDSVSTVRNEAEQKGLGLSWYIAPHLGSQYRGDSDRLRFVLSMLLTDAVRATERGVVSLRVCRGDMSPNPGHLQFTVADTGEGTPPLRRSSLLLARAWELAADHRGDLFVDGTPHGVEITFSLDCTALADDGKTERPRPPEFIENTADHKHQPTGRPRLVILASDIPARRQLLAWYLEDQGQELWEARDAKEAVALYAHTPSGLLIFDGHLPEEELVTSIAAIRVFEGENILPAVPFLTLTLDEAQAERLRQAGCDHVLPLPVVRGEFRAMALHLTAPRDPQAPLAPRRTPSMRPFPQAMDFSPVSFSCSAHEKTPRPANIPVARHETANPPTLLPSSSPIPLFAPLPAPGRKEPDKAPGKPPSPQVKEQAASSPRVVAPAKSALLTPADKDARHLPPVAQQSATEPTLSLACPPFPAHETPAMQPSAAEPATDRTCLSIPPSPKKHWGWLSSLFKPTPKLMDEVETAELPRDEWVGDPVPVQQATAQDNSAPASVTDEPVISIAPVLPYAPMPEELEREPVVIPDQATAPALDETVSPETAPTKALSPETPAEEDCPADEALSPPVPVEILAKTATPDPTIPSLPLLLAKRSDHSVHVESMTLILPAPAQGNPTDTTPKWAEGDKASTKMNMASVDRAASWSHVVPTALPDTDPIAPARLNLRGDHDNLNNREVMTSPPQRETISFDNTTPLAPLFFDKPVLPHVDAPGGARPNARQLTLPIFASTEPDIPAPQEHPRRRKNKMETLPFLSLEPNDVPTRTAVSPLSLLLPDPGHPETGTPTEQYSFRSDVEHGNRRQRLNNDQNAEDMIVDLTEAEMLESPLMQHVPDLPRSLDAAVEKISGSLERKDSWELANTARHLADRSVTFGLHGLSDLALCIQDAAQKRDFETVTQLLPDLRAEVLRIHKA